MIVITMPYPGELWVAFPYNRDIVDAMRGVPTAHWEPSQRVWVVNFVYDIDLALALSEWGDQVEWRGCDDPLSHTRYDAPEPQASPSGPSWAQVTLAAVGAERADAVFRALSKVLHPDTPTGSDELMRQLIEAREVMKVGT